MYINILISYICFMNQFDKARKGCAQKEDCEQSPGGDDYRCHDLALIIPEEIHNNLHTEPVLQSAKTVYIPPETQNDVPQENSSDIGIAMEAQELIKLSDIAENISKDSDCQKNTGTESMPPNSSRENIDDYESYRITPEAAQVLDSVNTAGTALSKDLKTAVKNTYANITDDLKQKNHSEQKRDITYSEIKKLIDDTIAKNCSKDDLLGLLHYRNFWELVEVEMLVNGKLITGIPVFIEENTFRVINDKHSYFIPIKNVDYIRTNDGLRSSFDSPNDNEPCKKSP